MADIAFAAVTLGFFALAYLYVLACDRIIGQDPAGDRRTPAGEETAPVVPS